MSCRLFLGRVRDPTKIDYRKKLVPTYSNLSTGGPRFVVFLKTHKKSYPQQKNGQPMLIAHHLALP